MVLDEDVGTLRDRDLWLELRSHDQANAARGRVPAYRFAMRLDGVDRPVGRISLRIGSGDMIEFYAGHDPEDYQHFVGDPPTDLALHPHSPGYRLILNNVLFPAARKQPQRT